MQCMYRTPGELLCQTLGWSNSFIQRIGRYSGHIETYPGNTLQITYCKTNHILYHCLHGCAPQCLHQKFATNDTFRYQSTCGANKLYTSRLQRKLCELLARLCDWFVKLQSRTPSQTPLKKTKVTIVNMHSPALPGLFREVTSASTHTYIHM